MQRMLAAKLAPSLPVGRYVLRALHLDFVPSILFGILIHAVLATWGFDPSPYLSPPARRVFADGSVTPISVYGDFFFFTVVFAPIVETLMMSPILCGLSFVTKTNEWRAMWSAFFWAGLHSSEAPLSGVFVAWPFLVLSHVYLAWRPLGWLNAITVTACVHSFHNFICFVIIAVGIALGLGDEDPTPASEPSRPEPVRSQPVESESYRSRGTFQAAGFRSQGPRFRIQDSEGGQSATTPQGSQRIAGA